MLSGCFSSNSILSTFHFGTGLARCDIDSSYSLPSEKVNCQKWQNMENKQLFGNLMITHICLFCIEGSAFRIKESILYELLCEAR